MKRSEADVLYIKDAQRASDWRGALTLTREMLRAAGAGDWDRVLSLEAERRPHLARFFASGVPPQEARLVRWGILEILESDGTLLTLSREQRREHTADVVPFSRRRVAGRSVRVTATG